MMSFTAPSERESQVGCLRVRLPSIRLGLFNPDHVLLLFVLLPLMIDFNLLTMFCFLVIFANKRQVAPRISLTNVTTVNYLLRSEIFMSEDRHLRAIHLVLDFEPLSKIFQEVGHAIRVGDPQLARINVSRPDFLA